MLKEWERIVEMYLDWERDGQITPEHIYRDAQTLLSAYTSAHDTGAAFGETMRSQSFVPESMFYILAGRPERIVLHDERSEKLRQQFNKFDSMGRPVRS